MFKPLFKGEDKSLSSSATKRSKNEKNPYAVGGRDKFASVLADLEKKRRSIYEQVGTQDISKVRFEYCDSQKWMPIVVRTSKDQSEDKAKVVQSKDKHVTHISDVLNKPHPTQKPEKVVEKPRDDVESKTKKKRFYENVNMRKWIQACYDYPIVLVLILSCLGVYGRFLAVTGTAIWWFLGHKIEVSLKKLMNKCEYLRRLSNKIIEVNGNASPKCKHSDATTSSPKRNQGLPPRMSSPKTTPSQGSSPRHTRV